MKTIQELDALVNERIKYILDSNPNHNRIFRMDYLIPEEEILKDFSDAALLLIARKYHMLLPACSDCNAVKPNGKWIPREGPVEALLRGYDKLTHGYCTPCLTKNHDVDPDDFAEFEEQEKQMPMQEIFLEPTPQECE